MTHPTIPISSLTIMYQKTHHPLCVFINTKNSRQLSCIPHDDWHILCIYVAQNPPSPVRNTHFSTKKMKRGKGEMMVVESSSMRVENGLQDVIG